MRDKTRVAIAAGDPAGIGPEVSLKAALDPAVRHACEAIVVGDAGVLERHAAACAIAAELRVVARAADADWSDHRVNVLGCAQPDLAALDFGTGSAASGRTALAFAGAAIKLALAGEVDAVVAAPQNETSIALAGIEFDGYPSFVARATGTDEHDVYLMLCFDEVKIVHATLHRSVRQAIEMITRDNIARVIAATDRALKRLGTAAPKLAVGGLNPHAGEGGLFGREEIEIIKPAIEAAVAQGMRSPARSAPTPCFTGETSTPSSSCCTIRDTSPRNYWRAMPSRRSRLAARSCSPRSRTAAPMISPARARPIRRP